MPGPGYKIKHSFSKILIKMKIKGVSDSKLSFVKDETGSMRLDASHDVKCSVLNDELLIENRNLISNGDCGIRICEWGSNDTWSRLCRWLGDVPDKENTDSNYSKKWTFENKSLINHVTYQGNGEISFSDAISLQKRQFIAQLNGSGSFYLPKGNYDSVTIKLIGSGLLDMRNSRVSRLEANLNGSGTISNFYAQVNVLINLNGSGKINGRGTPGCLIHKNKNGSGVIKVVKD